MRGDLQAALLPVCILFPDPLSLDRSLDRTEMRHMIRSTLKRGIKKILGMEERPPVAAPSPPAWKTDAQPAPAPKAESKPEPKPESKHQVKLEVVPEADPDPVPGSKIELMLAPEPDPVPEAKIEPTPEPVDEEFEFAHGPPETNPAPEGKPEATAKIAPTDDTAGPALTFDAVQEIMDEMVRPALQGDGGDITLLRVEDNNVYVKLVGSCSTCPSSIMTMKMGVEALLKEEFPQMGSLIQEG